MLDSLPWLVTALSATISITSLYFAVLQRPKLGQKPLPAFILQCRVTHARLLPSESTHAFTYPTLSLLLSLGALESRSLDIARGWLFSYGGLFGRVTGIRASAYLTDGQQDSKKPIRTKLEEVLDAHGHETSLLCDVWMMTMPSYLGYEGINPLTVYFCYKQDEILWLVVLEIHNTFGERHAHVLEIGQNEDKMTPAGFDHSWTFGRQFHVSPFNDRSGYYTCSIVSPSLSPSQTGVATVVPPKPMVRIHLYTSSSPPELKLTAILRPITSIRLSSRSLVLALARAPFSLLLSFPRIAYQAYILHFSKQLDVFARPEPRAVDPAVEAALATPRNVTQGPDSRGGGLGWQSEGLLEKLARNVTERCLSQRAKDTGTVITLVSSNPKDEPKTFPVSSSHGHIVTPSTIQHLTIYYRTPRFFTTLLMAPSAEHALLLGQDTEHLFSASSKSLFITVLSTPSSTLPDTGLLHHLTQSIRLRFIPANIPLQVPTVYILDQFSRSASLVLVLLTLFLMERLERTVFINVGARFVKGDEPWASWDRVGKTKRIASELGSVRRGADGFPHDSC